MLQFKKLTYFALLSYGKKHLKLLLFIFCSNYPFSTSLRTLFLILFSLATDINVSHAAIGPNDDAGSGKRVEGAISRKRSRSSETHATITNLGDAPDPLAEPPAERTAPAVEAPDDDAAESGGGAGCAPDAKRSRAIGPTNPLALVAPPAPALSPQIAGMFDLSGLDADPMKRDLIRYSIAAINDNRVGAILLRILSEQLVDYHRLMQAYSEAIAQLKPHVTAAFFVHLNGQIAAIPEVAEEAAARGGPAAARGAIARGGGRKTSPKNRFQAKVAALKKLVGYEEEAVVETALTGFLASPVTVISIISTDETCFNYTGPISLFLLPENRRIGKLRVHLDFTKIHILGDQPSSLTSCLGDVCPKSGGKIAIGMHYAPYYLTIAHELTHTKHFLQSIGADIERATQNVQRIFAACTGKGLAFELRDVFPDEVREAPGASLEHMTYLQALRHTDHSLLGSEHADFKLLAEEASKHQDHLSAADRGAGRRYEPLWNNLEERRTVIGPDRDGISELTLRLAADIPIRYLYQETDRHLFEDPEIIRGILERNNTEQVTRIFGSPITLEQILEVSRRHARGFAFRLFYALA